MDYIEVTEWAGVRTTVAWYGRPSTPLRFVIFPMVHVGEARYYAEVTERLRGCDLIVAESAPSGAPNARNLMRSYVPVGRAERLGLVVQHIDYEGLGVPVIRPDISAEAFEDGWRRRVPLWQTLTLRVAAPAVGLWRQYFATRRDLARGLAASDVTTAEEAEVAEFFEGIVGMTVDERDVLLAAGIRQVHHERGHEQLRVAIVWGAGHMRAATDELWALGYRPADAEWLTVFTLDDPEGPDEADDAWP